MAIYDGPFPLKGKVGNFVFYKVNGKVRVRTVGNMDTERWKEDPAFAKSRTNSAEFGGASAASAALRRAFEPLRKDLGLNSQTGHQTKLVHKVMRTDERGDGFRPVAFSQHSDLLQGFELNKNQVLSSLTPLLPHLEVSGDHLRANLTFPNKADLQLQAPEGASQFQLVLHLATLSDYAYDEEIGKYKAQHPSANSAFHSVHSDTFHLESDEWQGLTLSADLQSPKSKLCKPLNETPEDGLTYLYAWGIRFWGENPDGDTEVLLGHTSLNLIQALPAQGTSKSPKQEAPASMPVQEPKEETLSQETPQSEKSEEPEAIFMKAHEEALFYEQSLKEKPSTDPDSPDDVINGILEEVDQLITEEESKEQASKAQAEEQASKETETAQPEITEEVQEETPVAEEKEEAPAESPITAVEEEVPVAEETAPEAIEEIPVAQEPEAPAEEQEVSLPEAETEAVEEEIEESPDPVEAEAPQTPEEAPVEEEEAPQQQLSLF